MQNIPKKTVLIIIAIVGIILICATAWWRIFTDVGSTNTPQPQVEVANPLTDNEFPVLPVDPPKDAGAILVGPKVATKFYLSSNGKRYVFPDETKTFETWKSVLPAEKKVSQEELEAYPLGGNVWYRPGTRLIKIESDPRIYAVARGGVLREINEGNAEIIFGSDWRSLVDTLQDYYFTNYIVGNPINSPQEYSRETEMNRAQTVDQNRSAK